MQPSGDPNELQRPGLWVSRIIASGRHMDLRQLGTLQLINKNPRLEYATWVKFRCTLGRMLASVLLLLTACAFSPPLIADEPAEAFLQRLRELRYFDTAIDYLDYLESSPLCTPEFRQRILYEKAVTYIEASRQPSLRDIKRYEAYLDQAETWLNEFSSSNPSPEMFARAEKMRAQLFYTRGLNFLQQTKSDRKTASENAEFRAQARVLLDKAAQTLDKNRLYVKDKIDNFVVDPEEKEKSDEQKIQLQREYVQVKVLAASVIESLADTHEPGSAEEKKQLQAAVEAHQFNWQEYRRFPEGLFSAVGAARTFQRLGNSSEAIAYCVDLFDLDNRTEFIPFKRQAALIALKIWSTQDPLPYADIIGRYEPLVASLSPAEQRQGDWLQIQLLLARAYKLKADKNRERTDADSRRKVKDAENRAVKVARRVSRSPGPTREIAKQLLADWDLKVSDTGDETPTVTTFEQARERCRDMLVKIEESSIALQQSQAAVEAAGESPDESLLAILEDNREILAETKAEVLDATELALSLSAAETPSDDIAYIRYIQAFCYLSCEDFYDAIVIGEYLMDLYPSSPASRDAAGVAVKAYLRLYLQYPPDAEAEDKQFELERLKSLANRLLERWPGQRATESSAMILTRLALQNGDVDEAETYLRKIPADSPLRVQEEIRIGQMYWFRYLKAEDSASAESQQWLAKAETLLGEAIPRLTTSDITPESARGALSLVELMLEVGQDEQALQQLEMAVVAPIDLLKQKHPAVSTNERYASDTYSAAVRVYLAALKKSQNASEWINKIKNILTSLNQSLRKQYPENAGARMLNIYLQLAEQSKEQLGKIEDPTEKKGFADSLLGLLESISNDARDTQTLLWAGSTLNQVGNAMTELGESESARRIHGQAIDAFSKAREQIDPADQSQSKIVVEIDRQIALALRGAGKYEQAIKKFADVLQANPSMVNVQMDAAKTYQMWGDKNQDSTQFARAMAGGEKRERENRAPANAIWGWRKLCKAMINSERFAPLFAESLYNECYCRLQYGKLKNNEKALESALKEIKGFADRVPEMEGMRESFDLLAKEIQQALGQRATGLGSSIP